MNKIFLAHNKKKHLKQFFGVSYPTVRKALNGLTQSSTAKEIREKAIEIGGEEMQPVKGIKQYLNGV